MRFISISLENITHPLRKSRAARLYTYLKSNVCCMMKRSASSSVSMYTFTW